MNYDGWYGLIFVYATCETWPNDGKVMSASLNDGQGTVRGPDVSCPERRRRGPEELGRWVWNMMTNQWG